MKNLSVLNLILLILVSPALIVWPGCATVSERKSGVDLEQNSKEEDLMRLLNVIVPDDKFETVVNLSIINLIAVSPHEIPQDVWEEAKKEFKKEDFLRNAVFPVYDKHFTHDEIREMLRIYREPVMKKYQDKQSVLLKETTLLAREWGFSLGEKIQQRLIEKYVIPHDKKEL